jgi:fumarate hydratase, class II
MERATTQRSSVSPHSDNDQAPKLLDLPIGLDVTGMRREFDSLGDVEVSANRYLGCTGYLGHPFGK